MVIALGIHLFPFRTEKLSPTTSMVLRKSGRVDSRRFLGVRAKVLREGSRLSFESAFFVPGYFFWYNIILFYLYRSIYIDWIFRYEKYIWFPPTIEMSGYSLNSISALSFCFSVFFWYEVMFPSPVRNAPSLEIVFLDGKFVLHDVMFDLRVMLVL